MQGRVCVNGNQQQPHTASKQTAAPRLITSRPKTAQFATLSTHTSQADCSVLEDKQWTRVCCPDCGHHAMMSFLSQAASRPSYTCTMSQHVSTKPHLMSRATCGCAASHAGGSLPASRSSRSSTARSMAVLNGCHISNTTMPRLYRSTCAIHDTCQRMQDMQRSQDTSATQSTHWLDVCLIYNMPACAPRATQRHYQTQLLIELKGRPMDTDMA
jgi:hypothetical protein